ncbi:MAG: hypothetical protein JSS30_04215 [Verrucomicrobia bacterium]|nr:hypothetical protein [Verrucomicrobiota bacterium]
MSWRNVDYNCREMVLECDFARNGCAIMGAQGAMNVAVTAIDFSALMLTDCAGGWSLAVVAITSSALAINSLLLISTIGLTCRNYFGEKPFLKDAVEIRHEKCCYHSTIGLSLFYIAGNVATLVCWYLFCK